MCITPFYFMCTLRYTVLYNSVNLLRDNQKHLFMDIFFRGGENEVAINLIVQHVQTQLTARGFKLRSDYPLFKLLSPRPVILLFIYCQGFKPKSARPSIHSFFIQTQLRA
jgi:hypothetical protein